MLLSRTRLAVATVMVAGALMGSTGGCAQILGLTEPKTHDDGGGAGEAGQTVGGSSSGSSSGGSSGSSPGSSSGSSSGSSGGSGSGSGSGGVDSGLPGCVFGDGAVAASTIGLCQLQ